MIFSLQEEFEFRLPQTTKIYGGDITETKCLGRWPAEVHLAYDGFTNASFEPANFVLFNENQFAVIFLQEDRTFTYTRLETSPVATEKDQPAPADSFSSVSPVESGGGGDSEAGEGGGGRKEEESEVPINSETSTENVAVVEKDQEVSPRY